MSPNIDTLQRCTVTACNKLGPKPCQFMYSDSCDPRSVQVLLPLHRCLQLIDLWLTACIDLCKSRLSNKCPLLTAPDLSALSGAPGTGWVGQSLRQRRRMEIEAYSHRGGGGGGVERLEALCFIKTGKIITTVRHSSEIHQNIVYINILVHFLYCPTKPPQV